MSIAFVHLSDIHFGQEKDGSLYIHDDVKERLIEDVARQANQLPGGFASGVIVSGDIAYGGKAPEYAAAGAWLDRVAQAAGCAITDIQLVPGNHDIDRDEISHATSWMLREVAAKGETELDRFLGSAPDRDLLNRRFCGYEPFAQAYNSPLDMTGGRAGERTVELAPARFLRFIGLNTALICSRKDEEGSLLLGARQRVLPKTAGEELVVIAHHPLKWLQDSEDARRFVIARARVFVSGHEHSPSVRVERVRDGCDLMLLAAGAMVPPTVTDEYTYTYNILQFEWDPVTDGLVVTVHPRAWDEDAKDFQADDKRLGGSQRRITLGCPNFRDGAGVKEIAASTAGQSALPSASPVIIPIVHEEGVLEERTEPSVPAKYSLLRLRFFRDLTAAQRVSVLVRLNALPSDWGQALTHSAESHMLENLQKAGRLDQLEAALNEIEAQSGNEENNQDG
ncbi:MAG: metallophosphoesterase [Burkholderiales bacterium]|nr:metallophosphoesterase [Burkholderiales bacterium]